MRFSPLEGILELSACPAVDGIDEFGRVVSGAGGPSFFIGVEDPEADVEARVTRVNAPPALDPDAAEVVEFSCVGPGSLRDPSDDTGREHLVVDGAGPHRVRVSFATAQRGREVWQFWVWPADTAPAQVLAAPEPPAPVVYDDVHLEEAAAGLGAAARIGRDIDQEPGCRTLGGETGTVMVERICPGMVSSHRGAFYFPHLWTRTPNGEGWKVDQLAMAWYPGERDHPDKLAGWTGMIVSRWVTDPAVEVSGPRTKPPIDLHVNWYVPVTAARACLEISTARPLLTDWTNQRATFRRAKTTDGGSATRITIEHSGLPVEWVDDIRDWWTFQLAIHARRGP